MRALLTSVTGQPFRNIVSMRRVTVNPPKMLMLAMSVAMKARTRITVEVAR